MQYTYYIHTSLISGKSYVGYTSKTIEERWQGHVNEALKGCNTHFRKAIRKYGVDTWKHKILEIVNFDTIEKALLHEIQWIEKLKTFEFGYNMTIGGTGGDVFSKKSEEEKQQTRIKMSNWSKTNSDVVIAWKKNLSLAYTSKTKEEKNSIADKKRSAMEELMRNGFGNRVSAGLRARSEEDKAKTSKALSEKRKQYFEQLNDVQYKAFCDNIKQRESKQCKTPLGIFSSAKEAALAHLTSTSTMHRWLHSENKPDFHYTR